MVHPFLRRRSGEEEAVYPNEAIKQVLHRTLGVPIFQEQAMKLAVVAAGFTHGEADQLRRAMGKWRKSGVIEKFRDQLYAGMKEKGLSEEFSGQVFNQISGFGEYGFPESHAASFAKLVYVSCWLKRFYPTAFCAALINSQPMGFYQPAQLVADAKDHGVHVLPVDVNFSDWDCTIEDCSGEGGDDPSNDHSANVALPRCIRLWFQIHSEAKQRSLRLGLRMVAGLRHDVAETIVSTRRSGPFQTVSEFTRRTGFSQATLTRLSQADVFGSLDQSRRAALWQSLAQEKKPKEQPLFAGLELDDDQVDLLPQLSASDQVAEDYRTVGLSLRAHPMSFHRAALDQLDVTTCKGLKDVGNNHRVAVAGLVILRQRPSTAKGITFVTIEDETGSANLIVKKSIWERHYKIARRSSAWLAYGKVETKGAITHVIVNRIEDMSQQLSEINLKARDFR